MPGLAPDPGLDEADLVTRLRSGDEAAFTWMVTSWTPALIRTAARFVPTRETAEEVVQDTWLAVVDGIDGFSGRSALRTWVVSILIRKAQRVGGREHRSMPFSAAWRDERLPAVAPDRFHRTGKDAGTWLFPVASWAVEPDVMAASTELQAVLDRTIATLPRLQQQVVTARDLWGCDSDEVCNLLRITANHQRVLLHRARSVLRSALDDYLDGARS